MDYFIPTLALIRIIRTYALCQPRSGAMLVVKLSVGKAKPQSGATWQGREVLPLCGSGLTILALLPMSHRFAVGKCNQVRKPYS